MDDHHRERVDPVKRIIDDIGLTTRNGEWTKWCYILKRGGEGSRGQDWLFSLIYSLGSLSLRPPFRVPFFFLVRIFCLFLFSFSPFFGPSSSFLKLRAYTHAHETLNSKRNIPLHDWSIFFFVALPVVFLGLLREEK